MKSGDEWCHLESVRVFAIVVVLVVMACGVEGWKIFMPCWMRDISEDPVEIHVLVTLSPGTKKIGPLILFYQKSPRTSRLSSSMLASQSWLGFPCQVGLFALCNIWHQSSDAAWRPHLTWWGWQCLTADVLKLLSFTKTHEYHTLQDFSMIYP